MRLVMMKDFALHGNGLKRLHILMICRACDISQHDAARTFPGRHCGHRISRLSTSQRRDVSRCKHIDRIRPNNHETAKQ